jgi:hypothetical protein
VYLKVLSGEMDLAEIRFIQKAFIKKRGAEVFIKIHPTLIKNPPYPHPVKAL